MWRVLHTPILLGVDRSHIPPNDKDFSRTNGIKPESLQSLAVITPEKPPPTMQTSIFQSVFTISELLCWRNKIGLEKMIWKLQLIIDIK